MATLRQISSNIREKLTPIYGPEESKWLVRTLFLHLKGWDQVEMLVKADDEVSEFIASEADKAVKRLLQHEPIQYIFGETYWHGLTLKVNPDVLIPRPETSELVDIIAKENHASDLRVLDVCTGSGCIAIALAKELKFADITAIDISEKALKLAAENAQSNKTKISFRKEDALKLKAQENEFDIVVSNPPYIMESEKAAMDKNVIDFEPAEALFVSNEDPLIFYNAISEFAFKSLKEGGKLYFELNPLTANELIGNMKKQGWNDIQILTDINGKKRFLKAEK